MFPQGFGGGSPAAEPLPRRPTKPDPISIAFGAAVRARREERRESIETVAGRIVRDGRNGKPTTLDPKYLWAIEAGRHSPTVSMAKQIADALGMRVSTLLAAVDDI